VPSTFLITQERKFSGVIVPGSMSRITRTPFGPRICFILRLSRNASTSAGRGPGMLKTSRM